jgi:hypothetical protein
MERERGGEWRQQQLSNQDQVALSGGSVVAGPTRRPVPLPLFPSTHPSDTHTASSSTGSLRLLATCWGQPWPTAG